LAGSVVGHNLTYGLTVPDARARQVLLLDAGHRYWPAAMAAAVVFGVVAVLGTTIRHFRSGQRIGVASPPGPLGIARTLAVLQVGIFVVQETIERLTVGAPLGYLYRHQIAPGIAVQIVVAAVAALLLALVARGAETAGAALRPLLSGQLPVDGTRRWHAHRLGSIHLASPRRSRAPPAAA
jgi:hypothetical protein